MRVRLTHAAVGDLESIEGHITADDPAAAVTTVHRVLDAAEHLAEVPNVGRPGRVPGTRELVVGGTPFIAIYQVRRGVLWILRVLHGARRWPQ